MNLSGHEVIICTKDRPESLERLMTSLTRVDRPSELRLIVVENSNDVNASTKVEKLLQNFAVFEEILLLHSKPGLPRSRNVGLMHARKDLITFLDDDVSISNDYFSKLSMLFREFPSVTGFGPDIRPGNDGYKNSFRIRFLSRARNFKLSKKLYFSRAIWVSGQKGNRSVSWIPGCAMSFRREDIVGKYFNTGLEKGPSAGYALGEDYDFTHRLHLDGLTLVKSSLLIVSHHLASENRDNAVVMEQAIGRWIAYQNRNFGGLIILVVNTIILTILEVTKYLFFRRFANLEKKVGLIRLRSYFSELNKPTLLFEPLQESECDLSDEFK